jgi:hypothetical protein
MSKLLNYTSSVPAERSISYIEHMLMQAGATHLSKAIGDDKTVAGFYFQLGIRKGDQIYPLTFKLPVRVDAVKKVLQREVKRPRPETMRRIEEQSQRTAWKILSDWVDAQLAMIQLEQAEAVEIFLPYVYDGQRDKTYFEIIKAGGFKQLQLTPTAGKGTGPND